VIPAVASLVVKDETVESSAWKRSNVWRRKKKLARPLMEEGR
jgi:hypothetical protein